MAAWPCASCKADLSRQPLTRIYAPSTPVRRFRGSRPPPLPPSTPLPPPQPPIPRIPLRRRYAAAPRAALPSPYAVCPPSYRQDDFIDAYETGMAEMEADEDLEAEEEAEDDEDEDGSSGSVPMDIA